MISDLFMAWAMGTILQRSVLLRIENGIFGRKCLNKKCSASCVVDNVACNNSFRRWNVDATLAAYSLMRYFGLEEILHFFFCRNDSNVVKFCVANRET